MGNPKQKWTTEEEEALKAGVAKHGAGKWKNIQRDPEFNPYLFSRSNIDLKDKWRNMTVNAGEKSRPSKPKSSLLALPAPPAAPVAGGCSPVAAPEPVSALPASAPAAAHPDKDDVMLDDSSKSAADFIGAARYNGMIFEAISAIDETNGVDTGAIVGYIEQRQHQLPTNFRKQLGSRLRRLVAQEKLEKVGNCYKIKKGPSLGTKTPALVEKDVKTRHVQNTDVINSDDALQEAAVAAAYRVVEAENKSFVAAEAVKEAERVSRMAEDSNSLLQLAKEILEKCSRGEMVLVS